MGEVREHSLSLFEVLEDSFKLLDLFLRFDSWSIQVFFFFVIKGSPLLWNMIIEVFFNCKMTEYTCFGKAELNEAPGMLMYKSEVYRR